MMLAESVFNDELTCGFQCGTYELCLVLRPSRVRGIDVDVAAGLLIFSK